MPSSFYYVHALIELNKENSSFKWEKHIKAFFAHANPSQTSIGNLLDDWLKC